MLDFKHNIFLGHSSEDDTFAKMLAGMLRAVHLSVWIDNYKMRPGDEIHVVVRKALEDSEHAIFVVTESWLKSRWTRSEAERFLRLREASGEQRRALIPLLRGDEVLELPAYFTDIHYLKWSAGDDAAPDALFWQLLCALTGNELEGDESHWAEEGRRARGLGPDRGPVLAERTPADSGFKASIRVQWGGMQDALSCDRNIQWGELTSEIANNRHEAIFVLGPQGRAHDRFLDRVQECLAYPEDCIRKVEWSKRSRTLTLGTLKSRLAKAVGCEGEEERLEEKLVSAVRAHNLVLLHRPVCTHEVRNPFFIDYYTQLLPELITGVDRRERDRAGAIKIVQAVAWTEAPDEAQEAIERIRKEAGERGLIVRPLSELDEITEKDVEKLKELLPPEDRESFVREVMFQAKDSDQIFARLMEWLKED